MELEQFVKVVLAQIGKGIVSYRRDGGVEVIGFASLTEHANQLLLDALRRSEDRLDAATQRILDLIRESERKDSAMDALRVEWNACGLRRSTLLRQSVVRVV
jgi:hypothetical protein